MWRILILIALLALSATPLIGADSVLLASRRGGTIEAIDPDTLATVSRVTTPGMPESLTSDGAGQRLFVSYHDLKKPCCGLFALDLRSMQMSFLIEPALSASVDANRVFTQRGNTGIDAFDAQALNRLPTIASRSMYKLRTSPDGSMLFGVAHWPQAKLDSFDAQSGAMIASQPLPGVTEPDGVWLGSRFFLFGFEAGQPKIRPATAGPNGIGAPIALPTLPGVSDCPPAGPAMVAVGDKLAIYNQFGSKVDDGSCATFGGVVLVDPIAGTAGPRIVPTLYCRQIVASPDGKYLYGLDVGVPAWNRVRIVKIRLEDGQIIADKGLTKDVWYLTAGEIPHDISGRLDLTAAPSGNIP
jgi:hypothetical protein